VRNGSEPAPPAGATAGRAGRTTAVAAVARSGFLGRHTELEYATVVTHVDVSRGQWVLLAYRLPREPSSPRIAVWRKLRRLGVAQVLDGLVALPLDSRTREQLDWLADEVVEVGGDATVWLAELASAGQERALAAAMAALVASEYLRVAAEAEAATAEASGQRKRTLGRLRRELRRIRSRDYFPPPERETARQAVERLATQVEGAVR
jgi:ChrB-like protein